MKALYLPFLPRNVELQKDSNTTVFGTAVYVAAFFQALLQYSTYDTIYVGSDNCQPQRRSQNARLVADNLGRLVCLAEHQLPQMQHARHLIMAAPYQTCSDLVRIRKICQRPQTPITGVIHSLNYARQMFAMLDLYMTPLQPFDALICSSTTGRRAMINFMQCMEERFTKAGLTGLSSCIKMPVIPLGIETRDFTTAFDDNPFRARLSVTKESTVVLYFGRLSSSSKADLMPLMIVFAQLTESHPDAILVLAGDDTQYQMAEELREITKDLDCSGRVHVVPNPTSEEKIQLYHLAHVFVSLSDNLQETFGLTIVEAMAAGLPVIASDWNGYKDLVVPECTGYLIPTFLPSYPDEFDRIRGNGLMRAHDLLAATTVIDPKALKVALNQLLISKEQRRALGDAGQKRARQLFDWSTIIRQYEALWEALDAEATCSAALAVNDRPDLEQWNYERIFGHYPTSLIGTEVRIRVSEWGKNWRARPGLIAKAALPESWFSIVEMRQTLELIEIKREMSVGELCFTEANRHGSTSVSDADSLMFLSHIYRLMKCGFLEICGSTARKNIVRSTRIRRKEAPHAV
jgi:D-inositol-3-phosphate glycosyltransferase